MSLSEPPMLQSGGGGEVGMEDLEFTHEDQSSTSNYRSSTIPYECSEQGWSGG